MNNASLFLPRLTLNRQFVYDLIEAEVPACALGVIEVHEHQFGLLAIRPSDNFPDGTSSEGFELGHSLLGTADYEVVHFAFNFHGVDTYNVLVNPCNPLIKTVVSNMIQRGHYFILVIRPDNGVTVFRAGGDSDDLAGLKENLPRILTSSTTAAQYENAVTRFQKRPYPPGVLVTWACRDDPAYLDISNDRLDLNPSSR
ncbi:hypothetical protein ALP66_02847 [Pseudomonas amygdali pv. photiniae]|uniref:Uncharacterized protein n=1 Tax=Pseudomonas amygdali pv. photiniae TaxID=251724 RepID=A0A0P9T1V8_PSEA0|nr:hypothetical protein [Pseudomonas amygdali]KPX67574.1 hypothetical protein ALO53_200159 [Pseudomonas amygdali pv. photiniae]RMS45328.1 hypothetical protein ALP66_02847 [Pseudomonas amygdali pv. photiniae]